MPTDNETKNALHLFTVLMRCAASVDDAAHDDIRRHDLTVSEFGVMEMLHHKGPLPLGTIASKLLLRTSSLTHVIDGLVRKGLVGRHPCERDRRVIYAQLTDAGGSLIARIFPEHAAAIRGALSVLSPFEQETLAATLKRLGKHAEAASRR